MVNTAPALPVKVEDKVKIAPPRLTVPGELTTIWSYWVPGVVPVSSICKVLVGIKLRLVVVTCPGLLPGAMIPVPVPVKAPIAPVPLRVPPETA